MALDNREYNIILIIGYLFMIVFLGNLVYTIWYIKNLGL